MFRRNIASLISASEAATFLSTIAPKALSSDSASARQKLVPTMMEILNDHTKDASLVSQTAKLMTAVDQEASDSFSIAQHSECLRTVVASMKANIHNSEIKENCCRAIANVCMLPTDTFDILNGGGSAPSPSSTTPASNDATATPNTNKDDNKPKSFADVAVDLGAVEIIVGTLSHVSRLSEKGRCWAATALQNVLMFATTPSATQRACTAGAEDVLATFLTELCHDAAATMADLQAEIVRCSGSHSGTVESEAVADLCTTLQRLLIALDAASVSLARLMSAPAEENTSGVETRGEVASACVVEAAVRTMITALGIATVLTKVGASDVKTVGFSNGELAKARDECALPILHKGWEVLRAVATHSKNLPVVFNAIQEVNTDLQRYYSSHAMWIHAASALAPPPIAGGPRNDIALAASASASSVYIGRKPSHVLEVLINHAMLQIAPSVVGGDDSAPTPSSASASASPSSGENVPRLAYDAALATITSLVAPRTDVNPAEASSSSSSSSAAGTSPEDKASSSSSDDGEIPMAYVIDDGCGGDSTSADISRTVPTENAAIAVGCVTSGIASNTAVAALPRKWRALTAMVEEGSNGKNKEAILSASRKSKANANNNNDNNNNDSKKNKAELTPAEAATLQTQFTTVSDACALFTLLSNLADAGDSVASGPNATAVACGVVSDYLRVAQSAGFRLVNNKNLISANDAHESLKLKTTKSAPASPSATTPSVQKTPSALLQEALETQHFEIVAMQRLLIPVVGKAFTLLWNAVGTPSGAAAMKTLEVASAVASLNKATDMTVQTLQGRLDELVAIQLEAYAADEESSSTATPPPPATPSALIDGLRELERVGRQLYQKLDAVIVNPVYAQNKHDAKKQ